MSEHTPGPWGFVGSKPFGYAISHGGVENHVIADLVSTEANARLIAAAPIMKNALESFPAPTQHNLLSTATEEERTKFISQVINWNNSIRLTAIAKATGEDSTSE